MKCFELLGVLLVVAVHPVSAPAAEMTLETTAPVVSYQYLQGVPSADLGVETVSKPISYQFSEDFLSASGSLLGLASLTTSYQYCEWPGTEITVRERSLSLSYFYQAGDAVAPSVLQGSVLDGLGRFVDQALVIAAVVETPVASALTGPDGHYTMPELPSGTYSITARKDGHVSDRRVIGLSARSRRQDFRLLALPDKPLVETTDSAPASHSSPSGPGPSKLLVFDGRSFVTNLSLLDRDKMTVVLTHGWIPSEQDKEPTPVQKGWPRDLAATMASKGVLAVANLVAWDWSNQASASLPPEELTPAQGIALGEELQRALGSDYGAKVHFIGHSLGTLVNGYATDFLHGYQRASHPVASVRWLPSNTHVTMLDEAAVARLLGLKTLEAGSMGGGTAYFASVLLGWKNPVPHDFFYLDNFISSVGRYHAEAVNVLLQKGMLLALEHQNRVGAAITAHSYPANVWYPRTVVSPNPANPGFGVSFEYTASRLHSEFPAGPWLDPGIAYRQVEESEDEAALEVVRERDLRLFYPALTVLAPDAGEARETLTEQIVDRTASTCLAFGQVTVDIGQAAKVAVEDGMDYVANESRSAWNAVVDLMNVPSLGVRMSTGLPQGTQGARRPGSAAPGVNTPAAIWLPVAVPQDASILAFDFVAEGDGKDDVLVLGLNGTNVFELAAMFIPTGVRNTSGYIDVANVAGRTNEFRFGIFGGTSTNYAIRVDKLRFLIPTPLRLDIVTNGVGGIVISWPSSARGFVLESATGLDEGGWNEITNTPALFGGVFSTSEDWADKARFFRLRRRWP